LDVKKAGASLHGTVRDVDGNPLGGVHVFAYED